MNQMLQDAPQKTSEATDVKDPPVSIDPPAVRAHPRFAKPQRVAFVQSAWHREVVEECRIAFLDEIEARGIERARIDLFEVPGSWSMAASTATNSSPTP
jgi:6,7-dimethyl-8-ribityllumazine synthase